MTRPSSRLHVATAILAAATTAFAATAQAETGWHADIVAAGQTVAETERPSEPNPLAHTLSPAVVVSGIHFVDHATTVSAQLCLRFGVLVRLTSGPSDAAPTMLMVRLTHPTLTAPDHAASNEESFPTPVTDGETYVGWTFNEDWEMQPGEWTFALLHDGAVLASQSFTVTVPTPHRSICPSEPTS